MKKQVLSFVMAVLVFTGFAGVMMPKTAAAADTIGYVNANAVFQRHPDFQSAGAALQLEQQNAQKEFESKAASLDDKGKRDLQISLNERIAKREDALFSPIRKKIRAAIQSIAKSEGLTVILDSAAVITGGKDITDEVIKAVASGK